MLETDIGATLRLYLEDLDHFRDGTNIQCQGEGWPLHEGQRYPQSQLELHPKTRQDNRVK